MKGSSNTSELGSFGSLSSMGSFGSMSSIGPLNHISRAESITQIAVNRDGSFIAISLYPSFHIYVFKVVQQPFKQLKLFSHVTEHDSRITDLKFDGLRDLFSGDDIGLLVHTRLNTGVNQLLQKKAKSEIVFKQDPVVQIYCDYPSGENDELCEEEKRILVSNIKRTIIIDRKSQKFRPVGKKERDGKNGACFQLWKDKKKYIFAARPGRRIWMSDLETGTVKSTLKFPSMDSIPNLKFDLMIPFGGDRYIISWSMEMLVIIDMRKVKVAHVYTEFSPILNVSIYGTFCTILHGRDSEISVLEYVPPEPKRQPVVEMKENFSREKLDEANQETTKDSFETTTNEETEIIPIKGSLLTDKLKLENVEKGSSSIPIVGMKKSESKDSVGVSSFTDQWDDVLVTDSIPTTIAKKKKKKRKVDLLNSPVVTSKKSSPDMVQKARNDIIVSKSNSDTLKKKKKGKLSSSLNLALTKSRIASKSTDSVVSEALSSPGSAFSTSQDSPFAVDQPESQENCSISLNTQPVENNTSFDTQESIGGHSQEIQPKIIIEDSKSLNDNACSPHQDTKALNTVPETTDNVVSHKINNENESKANVEDIPQVEDDLDKSVTNDKESKVEKISEEENREILPPSPPEIAQETKNETNTHSATFELLTDDDTLFKKLIATIPFSTDKMLSLDAPVSDEDLGSIIEWMKLLLKLIQEDRMEGYDNQSEHTKDIFTYIICIWFKEMFLASPKFDDIIYVPRLCYYVDLEQLYLTFHRVGYSEGIQEIMHFQDEHHILHDQITSISKLMHKDVLKTFNELLRYSNSHPSLIARFLPNLFKVDSSVAIDIAIASYPLVSFSEVVLLLKDEDKESYLKYLIKLHQSRIDSHQDTVFMHHFIEQLVQAIANTQDFELEAEYAKLLSIIIADLASKDSCVDNHYFEKILLEYQLDNHLLEYYNSVGQVDIISLYIKSENLNGISAYMESNPSIDNWAALMKHTHTATQIGVHTSITPTFIIDLMCKCLTSSQILQILSDYVDLLQDDYGPDTYRKICLLADYEGKQSQLNHDLLETVDSYMWTQKDLPVNTQVQAILDYLPKQLRNSETSLFDHMKNFIGIIHPDSTLSNIRTTFEYKNLPSYIEDCATPWGIVVDSKNSRCPECNLLLAYTTQSKDSVVFNCGHIYHKECCTQGDYVCGQCSKNNFTGFS